VFFLLAHWRNVFIPHVESSAGSRDQPDLSNDSYLVGAS
jgi:hypothetical protein